MKSKIMAGALAIALSGLSAYACIVPIRVACPNDTTAAGIKVIIPGAGEALTDSLGVAEIAVPWWGSWTVCIDPATLPPGATIKKPCQDIKVFSLAPAVVEFVLGGDFCDNPPPPGPCWLTGGGTIDKAKGTPSYSFGGVVYPGCSPKAADGGNWNVLAHAAGLHFQGQHIIVDSCSGVATRSPKVTLNVIDFHGEGIIGGINADNPTDPKTPVTFIGRAVDNHDGGAGSDALYLIVFNGSDVLMQIGNSPDDPAVISTGNLQIHQSSCGK